MAYYDYILKSLTAGKYYIGSTQDVVDRLCRHNQGRSQYTKAHRPWRLVYTGGSKTGRMRSNVSVRSKDLF